MTAAVTEGSTHARCDASLRDVPATAPAQFHVLAKPTGPICNLDCQYCFYLSKEALYPGDRFRMSDAVLETYLRQLLESHRGPEVTVAWQGGEPTLVGVDFFRRALEIVDRLRRPEVVVHHTIQTNGTLLTDEWCELFARHGFLVGISIDGPPDLHDVYRLDKRGAPTFSKVRRGYDLLRRHGVETNILCTVNAANGAHPLEVYRFLRDELGARFIQLIPVVERAGADDLQIAAPVTAWSVGAAEWGDFLIEVFDEWVRSDVGEVYVQAFDAALASWLALPSPVCIFAETCGDALALEHNGDLYSCDHFVEPAHLLGNINSTHMAQLVASPEQRRFGAAKRDALPRYCRECEVRFACNGECPKNRFITTPDGEAGLNYLCAGYKAFFGHINGIMVLMAERLRAGGSAADVMASLRAAERNAPCPCGSGRKSKMCHQRPQRPQLVGR